MEEVLLRRVRGGLMGLRNGTKAPVDVWRSIQKLKEINVLLAEDYEAEYIEFMKNKQAAGPAE